MLYYGANRVFKSENRGDDWLPISDDLVSASVVPNIRYRAITTLAESPHQSGHLLAGTDNGDLWRTPDDGANWIQIDTGLPDRSVTRVNWSPHAPERIWVTMSGAGCDDYSAYVFRSDDNGQTWASIAEGLPAEAVNVILEDPHVTNLVYVGTDMGVYVSQDGGLEWQSLCSNLPTVSVSDLFVHPREHELVIGTHGRSCFLLDVLPVQDAAKKIVRINNRRELFVDNELTAELKGGATLELQIPKPREVVLTLDKPWEGNTSAYFTIIQDGELYRAWYRGSHYDSSVQKATHRELTCYAESDDGVNWRKPNLGLFEFQGSKDNNIVWDGIGTHCFTPFKDENPRCLPEARFKAISRGRPQASKGLYAFQSPDGIHWSQMRAEPVITAGAFDSQNLAFWDTAAGCYRCYHRSFRDGFRDIMTQTSNDFLHWLPPEPLRFLGASREHLYTNAIRQYSRAPHLLLGFPTRYLPKQGQRVEPTFMTSRDGREFHRWSQALIPETAPRDRAGNRSNYMAHALVALPVTHGGDRELSVFATEGYYSGPDNRVRRFTFRTDGFVALHAADEPGTFVSKPLVFDGGQLYLNYRAQSGGAVRLKLRSLGDPTKRLESLMLEGDEIDGLVTWQSGKLADLAGETVVLEIELEKADVFAFQFQK